MIIKHLYGTMKEMSRMQTMIWNDYSAEIVDMERLSWSIDPDDYKMVLSFESRFQYHEFRKMYRDVIIAKYGVLYFKH